MPDATVRVVNALGLHARAAAQLVKLAGKFQSTITIARVDSDVSANARSILGILTLAASFGSELNINVTGKDEDEALQAVSELFEKGFGEK